MLELATLIAFKLVEARRGRPNSIYVCSSPDCRTRVTGALRCVVCHHSVCYNCQEIFEGMCRACVTRLDRVNHCALQRRDARGRFA